MRYITPYSRRALVNRLAEKISNKLSDNNKHKAVIEVVDCINFYVVKGFTSSPVVLNLFEFKEEFCSQESEFLSQVGIKKFNLIDVIDYKFETLFHDSPLWFEFWNSKRPLYHPEIIDTVEQSPSYFDEFESIVYNNHLQIEGVNPEQFVNETRPSELPKVTYSSSFPYGYSFSCGKSKLLYCEYICNQLFSILTTDRILFKMWNEIGDNGDLSIEIIANSQYSDDDVKSLVLDIFDFNITKFETDYLKDYDFINELTNPFETKPWLNRDKVRELMIV